MKIRNKSLSKTMNFRNPDPMNEQQLEKVLQFLGESVNGIDEIRNCDTLTKEEQKKLNEAYDLLHEVHPSVEGRKTVASHNWEKTLRRIEDLAKEADSVLDSLPLPEQVGSNVAAEETVHNVDSAMNDLFEARSNVNDILDYDQ